MPNTLAHLGLQSLASKAVFRSVDVKWIGLGCLIPDLPWILQRVVKVAGSVDPLDLRLYTTIQATLLFSLLPAAAMSLQAKNSRKIFLILACNVLLHLLLDPTQIKWANGTHLLAPFSWHLLRFDWYWPEEWPTWVLTLAGCALFPYFAWQDRDRRTTLIHSRKRLGAGFVLIGFYLLMPLFMLHGPLRANNHFLRTLQMQDRTNKSIEFDRTAYQASDHTILTLTGERLKLEKPLPADSTTVSIKGYFLDNNTILVSKYHVHSPLRDLLSIVGVILILTSWLVALLNKRISIVPK
jgi:hypothetical protein